MGLDLKNDKFPLVLLLEFFLSPYHEVKDLQCNCIALIFVR